MENPKNNNMLTKRKSHIYKKKTLICKKKRPLFAKKKDPYLQKKRPLSNKGRIKQGSIGRSGFEFGPKQDSGLHCAFIVSHPVFCVFTSMSYAQLSRRATLVKASPSFRGASAALCFYFRQFGSIMFMMIIIMIFSFRSK